MDKATPDAPLLVVSYAVVNFRMRTIYDAPTCVQQYVTRSSTLALSVLRSHRGRCLCVARIPRSAFPALRAPPLRRPMTHCVRSGLRPTLSRSSSTPVSLEPGEVRNLSQVTREGLGRHHARCRAERRLRRPTSAYASPSYLPRNPGCCGRSGSARVRPTHGTELVVLLVPEHDPIRPLHDFREIRVVLERRRRRWNAVVLWCNRLVEDL